MEFQSSSKRNDFRLARAGDQRLALAAIDVDLGAHAEALEIQARFDGESGPGQQPAIVMRFVIVEMRPITMDAFAEAVAGTMQDAVAIPFLLQHLPCRPIHLPAAEFAISSGGVF